MKSFLRQIEESFTSLEEKQERWQDSDGDGKWYEPGEDVKEELDPVGKEDGDIDNDGDEDSSDEYLANRRKKISNTVNEEDLDEASTTAGVEGYNIPAAFSKRTNPKLNQSTGYSDVPKKKLHTEYDRVQEAMDRKYERLIEGYKNFALNDSKKTPEQKVKESIKNVARQLKEIETTIGYTARLKTESGISHSGFKPATLKALSQISERLIKISERVRSLGE